MEQSFNLKRALLLFKSIFICYKRYLKPALFAYVGIIMILCIIDIITSRNGILEFNAVPIGFILISLLLSVIFPTMMYFQYHDKLYITTSYMLPASRSEKFVVPLFIISIFTPILFYGIYVISISLFGGISELINNNTGVCFDSIFSAITFKNKEYFVPLLYGTILSQAACVLSIMLFGKLYVFAFIGFSWAVPRIATLLEDFDFYRNESFTIVIIVSLLFWAIAYLRFRKLQTKK